MAAPRVRVFLKGRQLDEVPFQGDVLRIGRMRENDVVIQNLSVSRFHATLHREGDRIVLRDAGSENGCYVNGERAGDGMEVGPGDEILVGKHELRIVLGEGGDDEAPAASPDHGRNDAWDGSATYVVGVDTQASMLARPATPEDAAALEHDVTAQEEVSAPAELFGGPDAEEQAHLHTFDVSEEDLAPDVAGSAEAEPEAAPPPPEAPVLDPDEEAPLDLGPEPSPEVPEVLELDEPTSDLAEPELPGDATRRRFAGLILQRAGRFLRVMSWDEDRMTLGRATDCDIVLATAEVSRRHAMLVKEAGCFEIRDLESINGTFVNGEKVSRRTLEVGDVIRLDDYELTFVVEDRPIGDEIKTEAPPPPSAPTEDAGMLTQLSEVSDLAPFALDGEPVDDAGVLSFDDPAAGEEPAGEAAETLDPAHDAAPAPVESMGFEAFEEPTMLVDEDDEKVLEETPLATGVLAFEVRVRLEELPPRLREALAALDEEDLRLPVELRLRTEA